MFFFKKTHYVFFIIKIKTYYVFSYGNKNISWKFYGFQVWSLLQEKKTYSVFSNLKKAYQENILCFYYPWRNANKGQCHQ